MLPLGWGTLTFEMLWTYVRMQQIHVAAVWLVFLLCSGEMTADGTRVASMGRWRAAIQCMNNVAATH
jgi:hypothetical protein